MKKIYLLLWLGAAMLGIFSARAEDPVPEYEIKTLNQDDQQGISYEADWRYATATNGAVVVHHDAKRGLTVLSATRLRLDLMTGDAEAEGNVVIQREGQLWRGEKFDYNFHTRELNGREFKTSRPPFYLSGVSLGAERTNNVYYSSTTSITTDNVAVPGYHVRCRSLTIVPGKSFTAHEATLFLGNVPVFYWPSYERSLERHPDNIELTPGYRSLFGPFLLARYNWFENTNLEGVVHMDYRQKRGVGAGPDLTYDLGKWGKGKVETYYAHDDAPGTNSVNGFNPTDRYRISFTHSADINTNLSALVVVREQSDPFIVRDFFEYQYTQNVQPSSFMEVNQRWSNWSLDAYAQPRINNFYETIERLPEVKLTGLRQQIGPTPLFYESESSLGYYEHEFVGSSATNYAGMRGDTYHQITLPQSYFGFLNFTPRVGGRFTHYSATEGQAGGNTTVEDREVFNTGAEISFKAAKLWQDAECDLLDIHGIRHIIEPSFNYVFVPRPNVRPSQLPQYDTELETLTLLPIEYPDYNAIDSIDSQNVIRFGLNNKLQTRRGDDLANVINWQLYMDWRIEPNPSQSTFSDLYSDIDFKPNKWITFNSQVRYDISAHQINLTDHRVVFEPNDRWSMSLGHRYYVGDPNFVPNPAVPFSGNNLFQTSFHYRINENWAFKMTHMFEARDGTMEEQLYSIQRDFRSWTGAITCRFRDDHFGHRDFTIGVTYSLKAFPRFKLNHDRDTPALLLGN